MCHTDGRVENLPRRTRRTDFFHLHCIIGRDRSGESAFQGLLHSRHIVAAGILEFDAVTDFFHFACTTQIILAPRTLSDALLTLARTFQIAVGLSHSSSTRGGGGSGTTTAATAPTISALLFENQVAALGRELVTGNNHTACRRTGAGDSFQN